MSTDHWELVRLSDIAEVRLGRQRSPKRSIGPNMRPYMRAANVTWSGISLHDVKEMDFTPSEFETYALREGDLLLAEASGSASEVGKPALWKGQVPECCFQNTLIRVRAHADLVPFLHLHFHKDAVTGAFARASRGVGIHHLGARALSDWRVQLPPLGEQRRIVEVIESYFTRLDDAVATLERVQRNLKRYRASVLKAAVEGRLVPTEAELARAEGRDYEPASVLLERILAERRRRWQEAELAKMRAKDKGPKNDKWKTKYKEPVAPDTSRLADLPDGWCWATVGSVCEADNGRAFKSSEWRDSGIPIIRIQNLKDAAARCNYFDGQLATSHEVQHGDLLFAWSGTPGTSFGAHIWSGGKAALNQHIFNIRFSRELIDTRFFALALNENVAGYVAQAQGGVGLAHITKTKFMASCIPLPPLGEQERIAVEADRLLTIADCLKCDTLRETARLGRLRQSILKWAFEGRLVDQDPNDKPARALLERIEADREAAAGTI